MRKLAAITFFLSALCLAPCAFTQAPQSWTSAEMYQAIRKLNVLGSVLYMAAHPDDENTRLIAYLSKDRLYRTGYLSLTRGDGGQNLIGDEQGIELGLIRTQELLAARRIDGGEQFFTRAFDFGYSKTPQETFTKWDKEKILSDVVWVIRKFQPDIIITRFPTTGEGGHGHHTASAILANEAFSAAADPNRFPEQLKYVKTWQVKRVLWNSFNFGGTNLTSPDQFKFDVGGYNPLLGKSYGEIAAESRSQHKSQGFGVPAGRGEALEYFRTTNGTAPTTDIMDGVDLSWKRVKGGETIEKMVDNLSSSFDFIHPEKAVKGLVDLYKALSALEDGYWKTQKLKEVKELIAQCSGLFMDATTQEQFAVETDSVRVNFSFNNRLGVDAVLQKVTVDAFDSSLNKTLEKNRNLGFSKTFFVPSTKPITQPYWLANKMEEGYFNVHDQTQIGQPDVDPAYTATMQVKVFGETFSFIRPVKYKFTDPVRGEVYQPLSVLPVVIVSADKPVIISKNNNDFSGILQVTAQKRNAVASFNTVSVKDSDDFKWIFSPKDVRIAEKSQTTEVGYDIKAHKDNEYLLYSKSNGKTAEVDFDLHAIKYDHIPAIHYFKRVSVVNKKLDLKTYGKKIAYIPGAGDKIPEALEQMGYEVNMLTEKELSRNSLDKFDAIITGVRAYNTNEWLNKYYDKLMKYVNDGGNLIVQYNT
ncbi:MAG TPA: PIG-L family deacetylase, partial [Chitinophagaceae bacterium]